MVNTVIDLSHHNTLTSNAFHDLVGAGITGVIHKATQGGTFVDGKYADREKRARSVGILWGAYHFLVAGVTVEKQLALFLRTVDESTTLLALDFEKNGATGLTPSVAQAHEFVQGIVEETGRFPLLYGGNSIKEALGNMVDSLLGRCPLWWAQYGPSANIQESWSKYTLWQYTGDGIGPAPHTVAGVVGNLDRNKFNGTDAELKAWWISQFGPGSGHATAADGTP